MFVYKQSFSSHQLKCRLAVNVSIYIWVNVYFGMLFNGVTLVESTAAGECFLYNANGLLKHFDSKKILLYKQL